MSGDPSGTGAALSAALVKARSDYLHDQLQREGALAGHARALRSEAKTRIGAMMQARVAHGMAAAPSKDDDGLDQYHVVERMLDEKAYYPPHDKRSESPAYARVHHQMTVVDDRHCLVCGVQHSTLADAAKNPFGAVQMETHHHTIEWALANAVDTAKFNQHVLPGLLRSATARKAVPSYADTPAAYREFDDIYAQPGGMTEQNIRDWVDHAADNLWVLCDVHHRHKFVGIHSISYPIWSPQDVMNETAIAYEIGLAKGNDKDGKGKGGGKNGKGKAQAG